MPPLSYQRPGLEIGGASAAGTVQQIRDLQRDLRSLGYLRRGIDGVFGSETRNAVKALQHDLLNNRGQGVDGNAPVRVMDYNRGRVTAATGVVDEKLAGCIADMLADGNFPKLPASVDPAGENRKVAERIGALEPAHAPIPYLVSVLKQESGLTHWVVPRGADSDSYIVVGTDRNAAEPYVITSRGYGAGQYTLFHHPARQDEVAGVMLDPAKNVERAAKLLREKLMGFVNGPSSKADDRIAERGSAPITLCKYPASDPRYLRDCTRCALAAGTRSTQPGEPVFAGSSVKWAVTQYYSTASYGAVPVREKIGCDWPYAIRRYNGGGINSYHYQARVLKNLAALAPWTPATQPPIPAPTIGLSQPAPPAPPLPFPRPI